MRIGDLCYIQVDLECHRISVARKDLGFLDMSVRFLNSTEHSSVVKQAIINAPIKSSIF